MTRIVLTEGCSPLHLTMIRSKRCIAAEVEHCWKADKMELVELVVSQSFNFTLATSA